MWKAEDEIEKRKKINGTLYSGTWRPVPTSSNPGNRFFIYHFGTTIAAKTAQISDFPLPVLKHTDQILPPSPVVYVDVDDDVVCAPRKKVQKLQNLQEEHAELRKLVLEGKFSEAQAKLVQEAQASIGSQPSTTIPLSECNDDGISNNIRKQLLHFAETHGITVQFNKGRVEHGVPILLLTQYAKSRPDFVLRLVSIQTKHDENPDDGDGIQNKTIVASSEHKKAGTLYDVGQLLAGCEKAAGDVTNEYLRVKAEPLHQVNAYAILLDFNENLERDKKCELFEVHIDYTKENSNIFRGEETIGIADGLNRVLHILLH